MSLSASERARVRGDDIDLKTWAPTNDHIAEVIDLESRRAA